MNVFQSAKKYRNLITIVLALGGIGLMLYYDYCDTACSYLKGDIFGIDLKWVGIAYMAALIIFAAIRQTPFVRIILAGGLGVELFLFSFQVQHNVYCPFCLAFSVIIIVAFILNYEVPSVWCENRPRMWIYFLGEFDLPMLKFRKLPLLVFSLLGYLFIFLTFSGSVTPAYSADNMLVPSYGSGSYEVTFFSDYFCPPCQHLDSATEPVIKELIAGGKVKITFIDVPIHKETPFYARYYLYAANTGANFKEMLRVRSILFKAAKDKKIETQELLGLYLLENKVVWKQYDEKPAFRTMSEIIRQNKIDQTPTCFIRYSATDLKKYIGTDEILAGLKKLQAQLAKRK